MMPQHVAAPLWLRLLHGDVRIAMFIGIDDSSFEDRAGFNERSVDGQARLNLDLESVILAKSPKKYRPHQPPPYRLPGVAAPPARPGLVGAGAAAVRQVRRLRLQADHHGRRGGDGGAGLGADVAANVPSVLREEGLQVQNSRGGGEVGVLMDLGGGRDELVYCLS